MSTSNESDRVDQICWLRARLGACRHLRSPQLRSLASRAPAARPFAGVWTFPRCGPRPTLHGALSAAAGASRLAAQGDRRMRGRTWGTRFCGILGMPEETAPSGLKAG